MRVGAIVQARMASQRLPGKVLRDLRGKPLLQYLLERLERCRTLAGIVIATSTDPADDAIADFCRARGVTCVRGSNDDVAGRFLTALEDTGFDAFVRISADSPLLDPALVDRAVELFRAGDYDVVTNVMPRTFPAGQSVEVVSAPAFRRALPRMTEPHEREHVTPWLYAHADELRIGTLEAERPAAGVRLTVDTDDELAAIEAIVDRMKRPHWEYDLDGLLELHAIVHA